jgi:ribosomal protein S28E/S33
MAADDMADVRVHVKILLRVPAGSLRVAETVQVVGPVSVIMPVIQIKIMQERSRDQGLLIRAQLKAPVQVETHPGDLQAVSIRIHAAMLYKSAHLLYFVMTQIFL